LLELLAGGGPAATFFSCLAKKRRQKKATARLAPAGYPFVHHKKWEMGETRYAQTTPISLSIFCDAQTAAAQADKRQNLKNQTRPQRIYLHG
jgi:hypothetical protein